MRKNDKVRNVIYVNLLDCNQGGFYFIVLRRSREGNVI
jgi:hypothetical protein